MKHLMKLKFVSPSLQKVVAVVRASNASEAMLLEYTEAPEDKSDAELLGKFMFPDGTLVPSAPGKTLFVIPTYHANEKLERCLKTLREQHDGKLEYEIVIVNDGGPNLESAILLAAQYKAKLVPLEKNSGFSAAVNAGIREGDENSKNIILVNDDLWFKMPAGVFLADVLERNVDVAIAGALLLYPDGRVQHAGITEGFRHILHGQPVSKEASEERDAWAVTGALFAISRNFLNQCGGLDERYQLAWEDTDLCTTAKVLGWKIRYCGKAVAYHEEGGTRGNTAETKMKNATWLKRDEDGHAAFREKWGSTKDPKIQGTKILLRRDGAIGDVLLTTPVIHALKKKHPDSIISVVTEHGYVFRDNPEVSFSLPKGHRWIQDGFYDVFYDLNLVYENNPEKHIVQAYADACGIEASDWSLRLPIREQDEAFADSFLGEGNWAALHVRALGWPGKEWSSYNFNRLSVMLRKKNIKVILIGNNSGDPVPNDLDLRGKTSFHKLAAIIKKAKILVGGDSLPLHIAQAVGTPAVGLFGDTHSNRRLIPGSTAVGVTAPKAKVSCLGCHHRKEPPQFAGTCDRPSVYCMEYLSPAYVLKSIEATLARFS